MGNFWTQLFSASKLYFSEALKYLFPWNCLLCDEPSPTPVCEDCLSKKLRLVKNGCSHCGKPRKSKDIDLRCAHCQSEVFAFHKVVSAYVYTRNIRKIHHEFKYNQGIAYLEQIMPGFIETLKTVEWGSVQPKCIVPVPTSFWRYLRKGYNQSNIIASRVSKEFDIPLINCLHRKNNQRSQTGLSKTARRKNVQNAFYYRYAGEMPNSALIIDDLMTTGYTLSECARLLRRNKVKRVFCATIFTLPKYVTEHEKELDLDEMLGQN